MRISKVVPCAALAVVLVTALPAPAAAQIGGLIKKKLKAKIVQTVIGNDTTVASAAPGAVPAGNNAHSAPPRAGPHFTEYVLEMTPELLDRFEKGLSAEEVVRQQINRLIGKLLPADDYNRCKQAVMSSPAGQNVYMAAADLVQGDASPQQLQKASAELARRFDRLIEPKCGLDVHKAEAVRTQHADSLAAAAPAASGLTVLQLSILKERILPFCAAVQTMAAGAGGVRIPTTSQAIYWVYTTSEMQALQPRCARLAPALGRAL